MTFIKEKYINVQTCKVLFGYNWIFPLFFINYLLCAIYIILIIIVMATLTRCFVIITKVCFNKWFWRTSYIMQNIYITPGTKRVWVIFCVTCTHFGRQWSTSLVNYLNMATQLKSVGWCYVNPIEQNALNGICK